MIKEQDAPAHTPSASQRAESDILTTKGAAQLLGVAVSTVQQWVNSGQLQSWNTPGGHRRIPLSAVRQLLRGAELMERKDAGGRPPASTSIAAPTSPSMMAPPGSFPVGLDETARLQAVMDSGLFDSAPEPSYDRLVRLAAQVAEAPTALFTMLDHERQFFKAKIGIAADETPRSVAFCNYTVLGDAPFVVEDATRDVRFCNNPLVTGELGIRFYAGYPLQDGGGRNIGTLCVIDYVPRTLTDQQEWALEQLAVLMSEQIQRG
jgi:excisionase family DNA binding protein